MIRVHSLNSGTLAFTLKKSKKGSAERFVTLVNVARSCSVPTAANYSTFLKVPKCEIFDLSDYNDFYVMRSL